MPFFVIIDWKYWLTFAMSKDKKRSLRLRLEKRRRLNKARNLAFALYSACAFFEMLKQYRASHSVFSFLVDYPF